MRHSLARNGLIGLVCLICYLTITLWPVQGKLPDGVPMAIGRDGAVASVDDRATQIGLDILRAGGNAVDAAVATAAALGVVEPFSAGIGGGGFMEIYLHDRNRVITLDGREEAPAAVTPDLFKDPDNPEGAPLTFFPDRISSGLAVGVPGTLLNWQEALNRYGTLSLGEVLAPSIGLAANGFIVDHTFAQQIARNQLRFSAFSSTRSLYLPNGSPPAVGTRFRNSDLAKTYRLLATEGVNEFYRGQLAQAIVQTVQTPPTVDSPLFQVWPGQMTLADLDRYEVRVRPPVISEYRGYTLYGMGLPSSGGLTVAQTLKLLAGKDLSVVPRQAAIHQIIEAERLAFSDRNTYLGDTEYVDVPVMGLLNEDYVKMRRLQLPEHPPQLDVQAEPGNPLPYQNDPSPSLTARPNIALNQGAEGPSTTHLTVADRFGNLVSYTLTLESTGGSGMVVPGYGFLLNNELTDFDPTVPHPNVPEPGKRPRSSMAPTIVFAPNGQVMAFGSPGGSTIITTVLGIATNVIDFAMDLPEAIAAPRFSQRNTGTTVAEPAFIASPVAQALTREGYTFQSMDEIGAATGIAIAPNGVMQAVAEPLRRGGGSAMVLHPVTH
jgi:gamma-glutamyltranspeptidase/glutathione hydrolase